MLEVKNLTKFYGQHKAVDDLSFSIAPNEVVALIGLNGAGKTTTLRMLTGFLFPSSGEITINNINLANDSENAKKQIGYLPENPTLYPDMTVEDFLRHIYRLKTGGKANEQTAIEKAMQRTQITDKRDTTIGTLSAGYRKRTALAQAIVNEPALVVLDEPIADLDPRQITEIRTLVQQLKQHHSLLISSHILSEMAQMADRFLFLHNGKLVGQETSQNLGDLETLFLKLTAE